MLVGPTGITFIEGDAAAVAKVLRDYSRTNPLLLIKGGVLGEKIIGPQETTALAELPSREILLAQLAGAIAAPMQQFAALLKALPQNLAYGLAALRDKKEAEGGSAGEAAAPEPAEAAAPEAAEVAAPEAAEAAAPEDSEAAAPEPAEAAAPEAAEAAAPEPAEAAAAPESAESESNPTAE
jgi:large subunit ribosomal protein L10